MKSYGRRGFEKYLLLVAPYIENKSKALGLVTRAIAKCKSRRPPVLRSLKNLTTLVEIFRDWINGDYKDIPKSSILAIAAVILYFASPIDLIFDFIPLGGLIDDVAVVAFAMSMVNSDLEKYKKWKANRVG